jgi:hypothetical protein
MSLSDLAIQQSQNAFVLDLTLNGDGSCLAIGGLRNPSTITCTMNGFTLNNGDTLTIDPSDTLSNTSTITVIYNTVNENNIMLHNKRGSELLLLLELL